MATRAARPPHRRADIGFAVAGCAVLAWYNNVAGRTSWHRRWYPAASGLDADDLGLRRDRLRAGLRLGAAAGAVLAVAFALAPVTPARRLLRDKRVAGLTSRQLAYQVLLRIPVGTVCWEEAAFRAVLHAALCRVLPRPAAIAVGSAVFGAWHIRPTAEALSGNQLATGRKARIAAVAAVVAGTSAAGAFLCCLRDRSGSLAAPVIVHLTANCAGPLASAVFLRGCTPIPQTPWLAQPSPGASRLAGRAPREHWGLLSSFARTLPHIPRSCARSSLRLAATAVPPCRHRQSLHPVWRVKVS